MSDLFPPNDPFEEHLSRNLNHQVTGIDPTGEGPAVVAGRYRRRRQRAVVTRVAAAFIVLAGLGGFVLTRDTPTTTQAVSDTDGTGDDIASDPGVNGDGVALVLTDIQSEDSPRPDLWGGGQANGVYYLVSTAPAAETADFDPATATGAEMEAYYRPDTLYTYDGSWTQRSVGDRYVSTIRNDGDVLYTVSTGRSSDDGDAPVSLALGRSTDTGANWTWTDVDLTAALGEDRSQWPEWIHPMVAGRDGTYVVLVNLDAGNRWDTGLQLAQEGGLDLNMGDDEILNIDGESITFVRDAYVPDGDTCIGKRELYERERYGETGMDELDELWSEIESEGREPTAEEMERMNEINRRYEESRAQIQIRTVEYLESLPECQEMAQCLRIEVDRERQLRDIEDELRAELGVPQEHEIASEEEYQQYEEQFQEFYERMDVYYNEFHGTEDNPNEEAGRCQEILYGGFEEGPRWSADEVETVTWAELGVTVPESWSLTNHAYLVEGDTVTSIGPIFTGQATYIDSFTADSDGYVLRIDQSNYSYTEGVETEMALTELRSSDGRTWTESPATMANNGGSIVEFENMRFTIFWAGEVDDEGLPTSPDHDDVADPYGMNSLARSIDGGAFVNFSLEELASGVDTDGYAIEGVEAGAYGVVAWASRRGGSDRATADSRLNDEGPAPVDSLVLYSADGISWGVTEVPGYSVNGAIVGGDGVMIAPYDPLLEYEMYEQGRSVTDLPPARIVFGRTG